ncbi:alkyl hydroperoxide reductase/thiol specific antioxidant/Mal allergen [Desulfovibrio sp. X2]|uniref:alkyl hydroperoxide reductase n=1 Tax=Desulfovibrio sp. X2 TaxID=941449 RepID=UPI000358AF84|nr:alkyl hydroperoxide reductase [Desulfovibrio sp. X2]EPR44559.1 alkyl hydroperoxide reductase/thiol specific antioxidant/Mal allergen [Desulfovibrio sp. X2]
MNEALRSAWDEAVWYNFSGRPPSGDDLAGRAVAVLAFAFDPAGLLAWRMLNDLADCLGPGLVPVGLLVPRLPEEAEREHVRKSLRRFAVPWPVADDSSGRLREAVGGLGRGELLLFGPSSAGEARGLSWRGPMPDRLALAELFKPWLAGGLLHRSPFPLAPEEELRHDDVLHFPEAVEARGGRVFVADTGAHRVIAARIPGEEPLAEVEWVAGGQRGLADGLLAEARFDSPRGLSLSPAGDVLYVADTLNHAVRAVDPAEGSVRTVAAGLRLPWDVAVCGTVLCAALPLEDRIVRIDPATGRHETLVETGEPLALACDGTRLWWIGADGGLGWCEPMGGATDMAVGRPAMQRPVRGPGGLAFLAQEGVLCACEVAANALRRLDVASGGVLPLAGKGRGYVDGSRPRFFSPLGLAGMGRTIFVADCFNHALRAANTGGQAGTLTLFSSGR